MSTSSHNRTVIRLTKKSLKVLMQQTIDAYLRACLDDEAKEDVINKLADETFENNWEDYNYESGDSDAEVEKPKPKFNPRHQFIAEMVPKIRAEHPDMTHRDAYKQAHLEWSRQKKVERANRR